MGIPHHHPQPVRRKNCIRPNEPDLPDLCNRPAIAGLLPSAKKTGSTKSTRLRNTGRENRVFEERKVYHTRARPGARINPDTGLAGSLARGLADFSLQLDLH